MWNFVLLILPCLTAALGTCNPDGTRVDCHLMNQQACEGGGCCWSPLNPNPNNEPWCFKQQGPSPGCTTTPPCSGHGSCTGGDCVCSGGFSTCGPSSVHDCSIDTATDVHNCGKCGRVCNSGGTGVVKVACVAGACDITCESGFIECYGACIKGTNCSSKPPLPGCDTFHENQCAGKVIVTDPKFDAYRWFTPWRGEESWKPGFQDYSHLVGAVHLEYTADLTGATATIRVLHKDTNATFKYYYNGVAQTSPSKTFSSADKGPVTVRVVASDTRTIDLEPIDFRWNAPAVTPKLQGDYRGGQKGAIVEMFGWPHADIEAECTFLANNGYAGVKVFPVEEQVMSGQPFQNSLNPWYFMYQPVSYRLQGRMGTRDDLRKMIYACRSLGVRVYADAVINHMTGAGNDANPHHRNGNAGSCTTWPEKNSSAPMSSPFYTQDFAYEYSPHTSEPPSQEFPAAMYGPLDFHCERALNSWTDPLDLNAGWLTGLVDLNTERDNVQERIADYLTDLLSIGFSGFRIDAAKHIKPDDMVKIFMKLRRNMGGTLPPDFISWWEVLLGGESDLLMCNNASGYNYGGYLADAFLTAGMSQQDLDKVKIWNSGYPKEPDKGTCTISKVRSAIQNDDADQQNSGSTSRDMGNQGCVLIKNCAVSDHRAFEEKLFSSPNGADDNNNDFPVRMVLSSFYWAANGATGVPDGKSDCKHCTVTCQGCQTVEYEKAFDDSSMGYDSGAGKYTRVHRDAAIIAAMQKWMKISV